MRVIFGRLRGHHRTAGRKVIAKELAAKLRGKTFNLQRWESNGVSKYSVLVFTEQAEDDASEPPPAKAVTFPDQDKTPLWRRPDPAPFFMLSWTGRILFLLLLSSVLIAVLIYNIVARGSEYQRGLTGKAVGVRFLFSGAGVLVTFAWGSFFHAVAFLSPYKLREDKGHSTAEINNLNPATNPFTGLWLALVPSRRDLYLGVVSATAILSEVLPLYLGNIPCNGVQIASAETVCVYLSVAVLSIMILTVGASFFMDRPSTKGVDPSTILGAMYAAYVMTSEKPKTRKGASDMV
ncbi:hypothetical protein ONZ43_g7756 [Nemania bipapillata]|uniref:Uncharacterized protein n=1 Tax=Nemania bipapillata TaxID=110536 RepID=A0ACC2HNV2_9PEZI|nr:hypothetical protein ONZ43_g7756 [Nemania bipapillata]